ncbi:hypothetical protein [Halorussus amylolyticus]|uniref:hypothetical protein n=1 Tax=Halorussus amylolyticus TaxID=1126242 RepID=UPI00104BAFAD|nr:hypothetical protein [Halorussus amylolyticus]
MTNETTPDADAVPTLSNPETLRGREAVEFREETTVHDDRDHCAVGIEGRAVVGVTNDDAVLVLVHEEMDHAMLPNGKVESGDDWAAVGRQRVEHLTDLPVEIDGPARVRNVEHVVEGDDEPHTTSYQVVFRASPAADIDRVTDGCDWHAEWCDELPEVVADMERPEADDIRLFVE